MGIGGLGKKSLSRLATFISRRSLKAFKQSGAFKQLQFQEWLANEVLLECAGPDKGIKGNKVCVLIDESQAQNEVILEYANDLLNANEIPTIFQKEDRERITKDIIELYNDYKVQLDVVEAWKTFNCRIRDNLSLIMCFSPVGESLRNKCRQFPSFVNCCTILWIQSWPEEAISSVSQNFLGKNRIEGAEELGLVQNKFHQLTIQSFDKYSKQMRKNIYVTPKNCLDNLQLFVDLYTQKNDDMQRRISDFKKGSQKLDETQTIVQRLKREL